MFIINQLTLLIKLMENARLKKYRRNINELREVAAIWWPEELLTESATASIIPTLLKTQEQFISILTLCTQSPEQVFEVINAAQFSANLFLKHLVILADYGGEPLSRLNKNFQAIFPVKKPDNKSTMKFSWREKDYVYQFKKLPIKTLNNKKLGIDGSTLMNYQPLDDFKKDIIMILLYGSSTEVSEQAGLEKCEIGALLGRKQELDRYIKQKYITVSRITGGATANTLGQVAQKTVIKFLTSYLGKNYKITSNAKINLEGYENNLGMPFDIVVEKNDKMVGIEVSFQVTTNSTIERKAAQAKNRQRLMHENGYKIAYIIDGAGNFQRSSAITKICQYSDCTIAYRKTEFKVLGNFIRDSLI